MGIYVWGTGCGASELISKGMPVESVSAFVDSFPSDNTFLGRPVKLPEELDITDCELVIVTARDFRGIKKRGLELGIPEEKMFYLKNSWQLTDQNEKCSAAKTLLGEQLYGTLCQQQRMVTVPHSLEKSVLPEEDQNNDYVRLATLELLTRRLKNVSGNVAELGVYKGGFACCLNFLMPERKLYLFDSFEGFEKAEGLKEKSDHNCTEAFLEAHKNTSIKKVLDRLPYPEVAVVCQGYFPESAKDVEDMYCLVSLDVDFEDTTYEGLCYFWPRMEQGGYLLLHDWDSPNLSGVKMALNRFEEKLGYRIASVPLCDTGGTLVLCK